MQRKPWNRMHVHVQVCVCVCVCGVCVCARITWQVARNLFIDLATPAWTQQPLHECA